MNRRGGTTRLAGDVLANARNVHNTGGERQRRRYIRVQHKSMRPLGSKHRIWRRDEYWMGALDRGAGGMKSGIDDSGLVSTGGFEGRLCGLRVGSCGIAALRKEPPRGSEAHQLQSSSAKAKSRAGVFPRHGFRVFKLHIRLPGQHHEVALSTSACFGLDMRVVYQTHLHLVDDYALSLSRFVGTGNDGRVWMEGRPSQGAKRMIQ